MPLETSYDNEFSTLQKLKWLPWVGKNYNRTNVLLIAESHYDDADDGGWLTRKDATRQMVNNQGLNSDKPDFRGRKLFAGIEKAMLNKGNSTLEERNSLWNNVAFYNLVQELLSSLKQRPTERNYDDGWVNFLELAKVIKPRICIKYGVEGMGRLGYLLNTSDTGWTRDDKSEFNKKPYAINLTNGDHKMRIIVTHHPAAKGFSYSKWASHIKQHFPEVDSLFAIK
jgi:hypothetical protein